MAKKKSSLSQALQQAQLQQQRAIKLASKKLTQQEKQPKQSASKSQKNKHTIPSTQSSPTRAQKHLKNRPEKTTTKTKNQTPATGHHESQDSPIEITSTDRHSKLAQRADLTGSPEKNNERPAITDEHEKTKNRSDLPSDLSQSESFITHEGSHKQLEAITSGATPIDAKVHLSPREEERPKKICSKPHLAMVNKNDQVLLVGEGNFSFTVLLLVEYSHPGRLITASTIDSKESVLKKYPDSGKILELLEEHKVTILFELDGCKLNEDKRIKRSKIKYDKVIFNFPHVGGSEADQDRNIRANQILILRFLRSVSTLLFQPDGLSSGQDQDGWTQKKRRSKSSTKTNKKLKSLQKRPSHSSDDDSDDPDRLQDYDQQSATELDLHLRNPGSVLITAGTCPPYSFWDVPALAKNGKILAHTILYPSHPNLKQREQPVYKLIRSFDFEKSISLMDGYSTYQHRQTNGFKHSNLKDTRPANPRTWEFQLQV
ncbi:hypothetical protein PGT21_027966 [Puccinia graminis f. sp. tritici]|uniref:25S rRNA (uridine-N(3))-methyltransferase BMT5-like domain-containing protein n=3 Tax=Puccinia graminis f. sp. tritici TaxID=56615 RepID=E3K0T1_PUCGT|nr:uncharacterized protein PGTG_03862 [Puccinia graminis f. sp. tritici CRL 75-36-700-3]EFP77906.2 hypothetical protein PGTG_03862 [Puccinia graminis f. sp. tritici CRL 75-36-700-3]KAA1093181.1 hypothetical protein PGT21_027966 [Puccinia graminis f. sp. tritici]KAA1129789.1 hypothetical protein PGTUg99_001954 [Puccinia graminis f. sp. tritici]